MRQLPPNPNLSHLKQQAKTLLAAMRETDPAATLATAQRALAERHGFRTWSDLKAEVDRRRTDPTTPDSGLIEAIANAFALGDPTNTGTVTAHDPQGQVIDFDTTSGSWTAHQVFDWVNDAQMTRAIVLIEAAAERDLPVPTPRSSPSGSWAVEVEVGSRRWRVDEAIGLGPPVPTPAPRSVIRQVGGLLADLHSMKLEPQGEMVRWLTRRRAGADWCHAHDLVEQLELEWAPLLGDSLTTIIELNEVGVDPPPDGMVLSHTCLDHSTVRLGPEGSLRITHWDWAGPITPSSELVTAVRTWGTDGQGGIDPGRVAALVEGYRSVASSLPRVTLDSCGPMISAWLNQLAGSMARATWASKDPAVRMRASQEVISMLENPLSRRCCEELVRLIA